MIGPVAQTGQNLPAPRPGAGKSVRGDAWAWAIDDDKLAAAQGRTAFLR